MVRTRLTRIYFDTKSTGHRTEDSELNTIPIRELICGMGKTKGLSRKVAWITFFAISLATALQVAAGNEDVTERDLEVSLEDAVSQVSSAGLLMINSSP